MSKKTLVFPGLPGGRHPQDTPAPPAAPAASQSADDDAWPVIHRYTRAQALADGLLVDVSDTAREAGFLWPVAVTTEVWRLIEQIPASHSWEDVKGRLWDVVYMLHWAIQAAKKRKPSGRPDDVLVAEYGGVETHYRLTLHHDETAATHGVIVLKALAGPGDDGEPVITILCLGES